MSEEEKGVILRVDLQCGECGAMSHQGEARLSSEVEPAEAPGFGGPSLKSKYCICCGAGYHRYCVGCGRTVRMFFEEWWPSDDECIRTYAPAKRCPRCNGSVDAAPRDGSKLDSRYQH